MIRAISSLILALIASISVQAQNKVLFKINPEMGKTLNYVMTIKSDVEGEQDAIISMSLQIALTPMTIKDNTIIIEAKYPKASMSIQTSMMSISYDSSIESADPMSQMLAAELAPLLEKTATIAMQYDGTITDIEFPGVSDQTFDKSNFKQLFLSFPTKAIAIGESWKAPITVAQFELNVESTNKLVERLPNGYKIASTGTYLDDLGKEIGKIEGEHLINLKTHMTESSTSKSSFEVEGQKITSTIHLEIIK